MNNDPILPKFIGKYKFHNLIGEGAFSTVWLVENLSTGTQYACKVIQNELFSQYQNQISPFEWELRVNQQLHHPNIVALVDFYHDINNYYYIFEYCPNGNLANYVEENTRLSEDEAAYILNQILNAMKYIHSQSVTHRDMKPENILLDPEYHPKICDFGLSLFLDSTGKTSNICGSPSYASPEVIAGKTYDGRATDIWSCGVILYTMVTGQIPWTTRQNPQMFDQIKQANFSVPSYVSPICEELIRKMMTVDPKKRITASEALKHPFLFDVDKRFQPVQTSYHLTVISLKRIDAFFCRDPPESDIQTQRILRKKKRTNSFSFHSYKFIKYFDFSQKPLPTEILKVTILPSKTNGTKLKKREFSNPRLVSPQEKPLISKRPRQREYSLRTSKSIHDARATNNKNPSLSSSIKSNIPSCANRPRKLIHH